MCTILNYPFLNGSMNRVKRTKSKTSVSRLLVNRTWQFTSVSWQVSRRFDRNSGLLSVDERYECSVVIDVDHELIIVVVEDSSIDQTADSNVFFEFLQAVTATSWLLEAQTYCEVSQCLSGTGLLFADFLSNDLVSDSKSLSVNAEKT